MIIRILVNAAIFDVRVEMIIIIDNKNNACRRKRSLWTSKTVLLLTGLLLEASMQLIRFL